SSMRSRKRRSAGEIASATFMPRSEELMRRLPEGRGGVKQPAHSRQESRSLTGENSELRDVPNIPDKFLPLGGNNLVALDCLCVSRLYHTTVTRNSTCRTGIDVHRPGIPPSFR